MFDRYIITPIIALGLAFLVWVYLRSRDQEVQSYPIPIEVSIDPQQADRYSFDSKPENQTVRVKFFGLPSRLREVKDLVEGHNLILRKVVRVPAEVDLRQDNDYQDVVQFESNSLTLPLGVHADINPVEGRLQVKLRRMMEKTVTLQPMVTTGSAQYEVDNIRLEPATVKVFGPKSILEQTSQLLLDNWQPRLPTGLTMTEEEVTGSVRLPDKIKQESVRIVPDRVEIRARLKPALRVYEINDVPIAFLCPANFPYRPLFTADRHGAIAQLKIRGPLNRSPEVRAYIDLTGAPI
ncbi:MAG: YbbR-like domain-containing protein [Gemmatales bacterium]